jgi:hypothetical protein
VKPIGPIVARIVVRTILARLRRTVWTIDGTGRKNKGPERRQPIQACNLFNSPDDRKDGDNCNPLLPDPISACKGEVCSFQAVQGCATSGGP